MQTNDADIGRCRGQSGEQFHRISSGRMPFQNGSHFAARKRNGRRGEREPRLRPVPRLLHSGEERRTLDRQLADQSAGSGATSRAAVVCCSLVLSYAVWDLSVAAITRFPITVDKTGFPEPGVPLDHIGNTNRSFCRPCLHVDRPELRPYRF